MCSFAPLAVRTAKVNSLYGTEASCVFSSANAAAWPSIGCETPRSRLYSCIEPLMRNAAGSVALEIPISTIHLPSALER